MNLILERVYRVCVAIRQRNQEAISFKKLVGSTRREFRINEFDLSLKTVKENSLEKNEFYVEAYYHEDKDFNEDPPIEVIVFHNFEKLQKFQTVQITDFLIQIYDAVTHELRHQHQYKSRDYENYSTIKNCYEAYLADPDELDAYALSIAIELLRNLPKFRAIRLMTRLHVLSKMRKHGLLVSPNLFSYMGHFKSNPLIKKLAKKVYKNLEIIDSNFIFK